MAIGEQKSRTKLLSDFLAIIGLIASIIGGLYLLDYRIQSEVESIISDENFLNRLIAQLHPYVIFDENNSILIDKGGMSHLDSITVEKEMFKEDTSIGEVPIRIKVYPNKHLETAPLLQSIDTGDEYSIKVNRSEKFSWKYELYLIDFMTPRRSNRFRLDIIR